MVDGPHGGVDFPVTAWRRSQGPTGNGVVYDGQNAAMVSAVTGTKTVTVRAHSAKVQGTSVDFASTTLNVGTVGTAPGASQWRADWICWKYAAVDSSLTLVVVPGTPGATPVLPTLTRDKDADWYEPIGTITRQGNGNFTQAMIGRSHKWLSYVQVAQGLDDLIDESLGTVAVLPALGDIRATDLTGSPLARAWVSVLDPDWTPLTLATGWTGTGGASPGWRRCAGRIEFWGQVTKQSAPWIDSGTTYTIGSIPTSALTDITGSPDIPDMGCVAALGGGGGADGARLIVASDGTLQIASFGSKGSRNVYLGGCYIDPRS